MPWTNLEYELIKFYGDHRYDAFANPDKVGLGRCACGVDMYYCDHSTHFARELIQGFKLAEKVSEEELREFRCHPT